MDRRVEGKGGGGGGNDELHDWYDLWVGRLCTRFRSMLLCSHVILCLLYMLYSPFYATPLGFQCRDLEVIGSSLDIKHCKFKVRSSFFKASH